MVLDFVGKSGTPHRIAVHDRRLARLVRRCSELAGQELFSYLDGDRVCDVGSSDVNDYVRGQTGAQVVAAIDVAACVLGNTRAVCRSSYVHPAVLDAHGSGALLEAWPRSRATERASRAERTVLSVLKRAAGDLLLAG